MQQWARGEAAFFLFRLHLGEKVEGEVIVGVAEDGLLDEHHVAPRLLDFLAQAQDMLALLQPRKFFFKGGEGELIIFTFRPEMPPWMFGYLRVNGGMIAVNGTPSPTAPPHLAKNAVHGRVVGHYHIVLHVTLGRRQAELHQADLGVLDARGPARCLLRALEEAGGGCQG